MMCRRELPISIHSLPGLMVSASVESSLSPARIWSKYATFICVPSLMVPAVGLSCPRISLSSVVLPQPFGPIRPILSPRSTVVVNLSISVRSP